MFQLNNLDTFLNNIVNLVAPKNTDKSAVVAIPLTLQSYELNNDINLTMFYDTHSNHVKVGYKMGDSETLKNINIITYVKEHYTRWRNYHEILLNDIEKYILMFDNGTPISDITLNVSIGNLHYTGIKIFKNKKIVSNKETMLMKIENINENIFVFNK